MLYMQIAGNPSIDAMIKYCFKFIEDKDKQRFINKFKKQYHDEMQVLHTFKELLLGTFLGINGFRTKYEYLIKGKTPDWSVFDAKSNLIGIVELVNLEIDLNTGLDITQQLNQKGIATYWENPDNNDRLLSRIQEKAQIYKNLVNELNVFFIIAACTEFKLDIYFEDNIFPNLSSSPESLFKKYPEVSSVICYTNDGSGYSFHDAINTTAFRPLPKNFLIKSLTKMKKAQ